MIRLKAILKEIQDRRDIEMVSGVAEILRGVDDMGNRMRLAKQMIDKFNSEGVKYNRFQFLDACGITGLDEADSPTERTRRYNRRHPKKVKAYLRSTVNDRVARNRDRAKAVKKHGEAKMKNHDVHHTDGKPQNGNWRLARKDHGPGLKDK